MMCTHTCGTSSNKSLSGLVFPRTSKLPNDPVGLKALLKEKEDKEEMWKQLITEKEQLITEKEERITEKVERIKEKDIHWKKMEIYMEEKIAMLNTQVLALKSTSGGMDAHHTYLSSSES